MFPKVLSVPRAGQFIHSGRYSATWRCQCGRELGGLPQCSFQTSSTATNEQCFIAIGSHGRSTLVIQRVNWCIPYHFLWLAHDCLGKCLVVFALLIVMDKVIADLLPEEVTINDWLIFVFGGIVTFGDEAQVFLNAACSLEWCDFGVEVGLEEKWDASICQERV